MQAYAVEKVCCVIDSSHASSARRQMACNHQPNAFVLTGAPAHRRLLDTAQRLCDNCEDLIALYGVHTVPQFNEVTICLV